MQAQPEAVEPSEIQHVLSRLDGLLARPNTDPEQESARAWRDAISTARDFLLRKDHPIVFVGEVGVGKSSMVAVAARLLRADAPPTDRSTLKSLSLLAIGAGRTTVCEVRVRAEPETTASDAIALEVEPIERAELDQLIALWAEDEWRRRNGHGRAPDEAPPTPQEVARTLRAMAGYAEKIETFRDGQQSRRRTVQPLDDIAPAFKNAGELASHLKEKMSLEQRTQTRWQWPDATEASLQSLKAMAEAVNSGTESFATLPKSMTFVLPKMLADLGEHLSAEPVDLELVDTRGLDAGVGLFGRRDLQEFVSDDRAVLVLCSPFKAAPGDAIRTFLLSLKDDARWRQALRRVVLVLLDQGDADQVNGAGGDRQTGQEIKISECRAELADVGISADLLGADQILALDVLLDQRDRLLDTLKSRLQATRMSAQQELWEALANARNFLDRRGQENGARLQQAVDAQIREHLAKGMLEGQALADPLAGLYAAVRTTRYASVIYASCRRKGEYRNLNLYESIKAEASRALTAWLTPPMRSVLAYLKQAAKDPSLSEISDFINLRVRQFGQGFIEAVTSFANAVEGEVRKALLTDDALWLRCSSEWGRGGGFKPNVLDHMKKWASGQPFSAHADMQHVGRAIPFWGDVVKPVRPPQFGLHVRQLRALRKVEWKPAAVSLLIGANGAGKTTTLLVLRLLRLAYERGLAEAVRLALGGSHNLGSWGRREDEPVEVGVSLGRVRWRIALNLGEGSVDPVAEEELVDGDEVVFSRDALGVFRHKEQVVSSETGPTALRVLVDRGAVDAPIRSVATFLQRVSVFQEPDLFGLRRGSPAEDDQALDVRGVNAVSVLRRWHQNRQLKDKFDFVAEGLKEAFPKDFDAIDFHQAGSTLTARIYRPGSEQPSWLMDAANGLLQMMVLLCDVAHADDGGVVAIDEPENGLHPFALRVFLRKTRQWASRHHVTVLLATHSTVLLDELNATPGDVFVMGAAGGQDEQPIPLDRLRDPEWIHGFNLGELYSQGEIGSNSDA